VPLVLVAVSLLVRDILALGAVAGVVAGGWTGHGIGKQRAARKVAACRDGVRVIPLELITSCRSTGPRGSAAG
jgi:hypothetical protein